VANHVFGGRRLRCLDTVFNELAMDARGSPKQIRHAHLPDEVLKLQRQFGPTWPIAPAFPGPIPPESLAMPEDYRHRFDDALCRTPVRTRPGEPHSEETIANTEADTSFQGSSKDYDLVPQVDDLSLELQAALEPRTKKDE